MVGLLAWIGYQGKGAFSLEKWCIIKALLLGRF